MTDEQLLQCIYQLQSRLRLRNPTTPAERWVWKQLRNELSKRVAKKEEAHT